MKVKLKEPKASLYPVPVTLISCANKDCENVITVSWAGIMCSTPPIIYIAIRPSRKSYQLLKDSGRFCLNIPDVGLLKKVDLCGKISGFIADKIELCSFDMIPLVEGYPRAIGQCKHHLFCDIIQCLELGSHTAFVAEVKYEYIDDDCIIDDHQFNYESIKPISYCRKMYYSISERLGSYHNIN